MGRYFNVGNFEGKFWFAVQPSSDPEIFGMVPKDHDDMVVDYSIKNTPETRAKVGKKIDELYDILGVESGNGTRVYTCGSQEYLADYLWDICLQYLYRDRDPNHEADAKVMGTTPPKDMEHLFPHGMIPDSKEKELAAARIELGIMILSTMSRCTDLDEIILTGEY